MTEWPGAARTLSGDELFALDCEVLVPAALERAVVDDHVSEVRSRLIVEAANNPVTCTAAEQLNNRGVAIVPDVMANAGGVIASYFEWAQNMQGDSWQEGRALHRLETMLSDGWRAISDRARVDDVDWRTAAYRIAFERVRRAERHRGHSAP